MTEHPYDELPGLLFGELNRAEVTVVSDHLAGCDDCRRELAVLAAASASLRATAHQAQATPAVQPVQPSRAGRAGWRRRPVLGLAAALALALALVAAVVLWTGPLRPGRLSSTVALAGVGAVAASGQASMAGDGGDRRMTVTAAGLPALRPGQYYEVWLLDPDRGTVFPVGVLPRDGEGRFTLPASVIGRYQAVDVSLEADDGDPAHSRRSLLRGRYA
jgi:Anti-sigma-K factor rskA/Putative zinc-finger